MHPLRRRLDEMLGTALPDAVWRQLEEDGYVGEAEALGRPAFDRVVDAARQYLRSSGTEASRHGQSPLRQSGRGVADLEEEILLRARVTADYFAAMISGEPKVRRFRREVLGGLRSTGERSDGWHSVVDGRKVDEAEAERAGTGVLTDAEADALLESHPARVLSVTDFARLEMPVVGHETVAFVEAEPRMGAGPDRPAEGGWWSIDVDIKIRSGERYADVTRSLAQCVLDNKPDKRRRRPFPLRSGNHRLMDDSLPDGWCSGPRTPTTIRVWPNSLLDDLWELGSWLSDRYPWSAPLAVWCVLTGEPPSPRPVDVSYSTLANREATFARVTMTIEPWVPEPVVRRAYRSLQIDMLGGDNRQVDGQMLERVSWVAQRRAAGQRPTWTAWVAEWDGSHPEEQQHGGDYRRFRTYWARALAGLFPRYRLPGRNTGSSEREEIK